MVYYRAQNFVNFQDAVTEKSLQRYKHDMPPVELTDWILTGNLNNNFVHSLRLTVDQGGWSSTTGL